MTEQRIKRSNKAIKKIMTQLVYVTGEDKTSFFHDSVQASIFATENYPRSQNWSFSLGFGKTTIRKTKNC